MYVGHRTSGKKSYKSPLRLWLTSITWLFFTSVGRIRISFMRIGPFYTFTSHENQTEVLLIKPRDFNKTTVHLGFTCFVCVIDNSALTWRPAVLHVAALVTFTQTRSLSLTWWRRWRRRQADNGGVPGIHFRHRERQVRFFFNHHWMHLPSVLLVSHKPVFLWPFNTSVTWRLTRTLEYLLFISLGAWS